MAKIFFRDKPIIGLEISTTGIKVMSIDPKRWLVLGYGSLYMDPLKAKESFDESSSYLADNLKILLNEKIIGNLPSNHVVIGLPTAKTYSRTFSLPLAVEKSLNDAIEVEVDQYIPIPVQSLNIDYEIIERNKKEITVLMSAISKATVEKCVNATMSAGLLPTMIESSISAVGRVLTATEDGSLPTVIVDIGPASTDIAILLDGSIRVTGSVPIGGNTFTLDIAKKMGVTLENAHQLKVLNGLSAGSRQQKITNALSPSLNQIIIETQRVIRYYSERLNPDRKLEQLLVVGSGSNVPGIGEYFTNSLVMAARVASPWQKLDFGKLSEPAKQFRSRYITVAGLASVDPEDIWK